LARILLVEDDLDLAIGLAAALAEDGHDVMHAASGHQALGMLALNSPRAVVLDLGLPDISGLEVLRRLRADRQTAGVLILTARNALEDRVTGLRLGADDYLGKPFATSELRARVSALVRRGFRTEQEVIAVGPLRLDPYARRAWHGETELSLSPREYELLRAFMHRPGEVLDRLELLRAAWGPEMELRSNVVNVYVRYLRSKIDEPFGTDLLKTVRGSGYRLGTGE
jgi:two-component system OmpR family response regulator